MLAARLYGANDLRLEDIPVPEIGDNEILMRVRKAAVCGTDLRMYQNGAAAVSPERPLILGHEFSGDIEQVGKNVHDWKKGQRVVLAPNIGCGRCSACVAGDPHLCDTITSMGVNIDGAFAEYIRIPEQALTYGNIFELEENTSYEAAALNEALSCVYNGFLHYGVNVGDSVLIIGAGAIGVMHAQLAKLAGAAKVMLNDMSEERLDLCRKIDPSFISIPMEDIHERILKETKGKGLDVCVTACPAPAAQQVAIELMGFGGRVNFFGGLPKSKEIVPINTNIIHYKQLHITGATKANIDMVYKTLNLIESGVLPVGELITAHFPLRDLKAALEYAGSGQGLKAIIDIS